MSLRPPQSSAAQLNRSSVEARLEQNDFILYKSAAAAMNDHLSKLTVEPSATVRQTMAAIDAGVSGIAMVTNSNNQLLGVVTDGDLRRMLLADAELDSPIEGYVQSSFTSVLPNTARADVLDLMVARSIEHIPITDQSNQLLGLHCLSSLISKDPLPNWAVIMAGGKGTRLGELTKSTPKPMLKVAGRPILERIVLHLVGAGIRKIFIAVNYLAEVIEEHFKDGSHLGCEIIYLREDEPLGSGGALSLLPETPEHPLLVMNGDLVTDFHVRRMLNYHQAGNYLATIGLNHYTHQVPFGCVQLSDGEITQLREKPLLSELINCGIYALSPALLERVHNAFFPITNLFEDCLKNQEPLGGYVISEDWTDVGLPEELNMARGLT